MSEQQDILSDLAVVFRGLWDTAWHDLNRRQVTDAYDKVDEAIQEYAAMREIVEAVANADPVSDEARAYSEVPGWLLVGIDQVYVTKARELLRKSSESEEVQ